MKIRELSVPDSYEITPRVFPDERGKFYEAYRFDALVAETGRAIDLKQVNTSVSSKGVVRGIHFADVPPSQAKYVMAPHGAVLDFIIDIRVGSPTFGEWDSVLLDGTDRRAVFISEGLGHAFIALTDDAVVTYLVTSPYNPQIEHDINPLDATVALRWPDDAGEPVLSPKDTAAPSLEDRIADGSLPTWDECRAFYEQLRTKE